MGFIQFVNEALLPALALASIEIAAFRERMATFHGYPTGTPTAKFLPRDRAFLKVSRAATGLILLGVGAMPFWAHILRAVGF